MYEGALAKTLVQPLTSYHLFRPPLSQLSFCLVIHLDQLKTDFLDLWSRFNLLSSLICEIKQFCGRRKSWPHCLMITRFIAVKFCNKRLQCLGFYENHLAIIKWGNCSRLECFMLTEVTLVMFSVSSQIGIMIKMYDAGIKMILTWRRLLRYDRCVGLFLKYWVVVVQVSHLCKWKWQRWLLIVMIHPRRLSTCTLRVAEELNLASVCSSVATTSKMKFCSFGFSKSSFYKRIGVRNCGALLIGIRVNLVQLGAGN